LNRRPSLLHVNQLPIGNSLESLFSTRFPITEQNVIGNPKIKRAGETVTQRSMAAAMVIGRTDEIEITDMMENRLRDNSMPAPKQQCAFTGQTSVPGR
jgi:hypothetical protein